MSASLNSAHDRNSVTTSPVILIVDDDPDIRESVAAALQGMADQIVLADGGDAALNFVKNHKISVAVIDLVMPKIGGVECLSKIRDASPSTSCIMMSGMTQDRKIIARCLEMGAISFVGKPIEIPLLKKIVISGIDSFKKKEREK